MYFTGNMGLFKISTHQHNTSTPVNDSSLIYLSLKKAQVNKDQKAYYIIEVDDMSFFSLINFIIFFGIYCNNNKSNVKTLELKPKMYITQQKSAI